MKPVIAIPSYLPEKNESRVIRRQRVNALLRSLEEKFPDIDIIIVAQNWKRFRHADIKNNVYVHHFDRLGITQARKKLREIILASDYDYVIMLDDDAVIQGTNEEIQEYLKLMEEHPQGFSFIENKPDARKDSRFTPFAPSQLNLCAISRYIYEREDIPSVSAEKDEAYEDRVYAALLYWKYHDNYFKAPVNVRTIHFKDGVTPSTWSTRKRNHTQILSNTFKIECYIARHQELPPLPDFLYNKGEE